MKILTLAERLVVAADFQPKAEEKRKGEWVRGQVLSLADNLGGTGVCLKVNSALRYCGYDLIREIHTRRLRVFADLKLFDIGATLATDGQLLSEYWPEILTVVCTAGHSAIQSLKTELPTTTEVLGVTVLTSLSEDDTKEMFLCSTAEAVKRFAHVAYQAGVDGLISSPKEVHMLRAEFGDLLSYNTPGIRPAWAIVPGDDQNPERIMTPAKAVQAGADRIVVGRPIMMAKDPREAVMRTLDEIDSVI